MPTAVLTLLESLDQEIAPHTAGRVDYPLDVIVRAAREPEELSGLQADGWHYDGCLAQDGGAEDGDGNPVLDAVLNFSKEFDARDGAAGAADARRCGVTDELAPMLSWADGYKDADRQSSWALEEFERH